MLDLKDALKSDLPAEERVPARRTQGLILAAGRGRRLGAKVEEVPKCLLRVGGKTLLDHQLDMLESAGVRDICVVAGYQKRSVFRACHRRATVISNDHWADTNSLYSLSLARQWVDRNVVVMNCDVLVVPTVLTQLLATRSSCFAYDSSSGSDDEHMKVALFGNRLVAMSKSLESASVHGENVGLLHFLADDAQRLFAHAEAILANGSNTQWMASAVQRLAEESPLQGVDVRGRPWIEIDYPEDLEDARQRVWPLIRQQHLSAETRRDARRVNTATAALCHESA